MPIYPPYNRFFAPVTFNGETAFNDRVTITQVVSGAREALRLRGGNALANIVFVDDFFTNPLFVIPTDGGDAMLGDRRRAFRPGDITNVDWQTLTKTTDNVSVNAGGYQLGHGTGVIQFYAGSGAPSAVHPVTTGIPPNGTFYFRQDGGAGTSLYMVRAGAWVAIL